jgi:hypothetical protein
MNEPHDHPPESAASPRRRWGCLVTCLVVVGLGVGLIFFLAARRDWDLKEAGAEADRLDPGWRLEQIEEKRAHPPDPANSAVQVQAVHRLIPTGWGSSQGYTDLFQDQPPEVEFNARQTAALKEELQKAEKARAEARKLAQMPDGNLNITYAPNWIGTLLPTVQDTRQVASLLRDDAFLRAQEKDADGAVRSLLAGLNAGRSIGDAPMAVSQLVRIACVSVAVMNLERILAQGEPSPDVLLEMQRQLEEEERFPYLLVMCRGERAGCDQLMTWMEAGNAGPSGAAALGTSGAGMELLMHVPGEMKREHAALLRYLNQLVEAAKLPEREQQQRMKELEATIQQQPVLVRLLAPAMLKVGEASHRMHAQLRCAIVMVAAERYRQQKKRWPASVQALVRDGYLQAVPVDPYDGAPIRLKQLPDGLVIYSTGPDKTDDGGHLDRKNFLAKGTDLGFRLWDVARRRQPAPPPKPAQPPEGGPGGAAPGPGDDMPAPNQGP